MIRDYTKVNAKNNFFLYVFAMMSGGLLVSGVFAVLFGMVISSFTSMGFMITLIIAVICGLITDYLFEKNILNNSLGVSLSLYGLSSIFTGLFLSPMYLLAMYGYMDIILQAFMGTLLIFVSLSVYAYFSKKDFTSLRSILVAGCMAMIILSLIKLVLYFVAPAISHYISIGVSFLSIILSSGFVLYHLSDLSNLYNKNSNNFIVLSRMGLLGAHYLLKQFVSIFMNLVNILLRSRKRRD